MFSTLLFFILFLVGTIICFIVGGSWGIGLGIIFAILSFILLVSLVGIIIRLRGAHP